MSAALRAVGYVLLAGLVAGTALALGLLLALVLLGRGLVIPAACCLFAYVTAYALLRGRLLDHAARPRRLRVALRRPPAAPPVVVAVSAPVVVPLHEQLAATRPLPTVRGAA